MPPTLSIRPVVGDAEILACHPLIRSLRPQLTAPADWLTYVRRQNTAEYGLLAAWSNDAPLALASHRRWENLVYGRFLYVEDLVTQPDQRGQGLGAALLAALAALARADARGAVVLDAAADNLDAHRFYLRQGLRQRSLRFTLPL